MGSSCVLDTVSVGENKVLEVDGGGNCRTMNILNATELYT